MPIFEYVCSDCGREFESIVFGSREAACPGCQGQHLKPKFSTFVVKTGSAHKTPTAAQSGPCGSCGDARRPGACSLGDLD